MSDARFALLLKVATSVSFGAMATGMALAGLTAWIWAWFLLIAFLLVC